MDNGQILIVDDDLDIREVLAETLEDRGFGVLTAANGLEAICLVRGMTVPPSVILLDLMMPIMDGYEFLEELSVDRRLASIPIAIITAGHRVDRARVGDGAPILRKPIELGALDQTIRDLRAAAGISA